MRRGVARRGRGQTSQLAGRLLEAVPTALAVSVTSVTPCPRLSAGSLLRWERRHLQRSWPNSLVGIEAASANVLPYSYTRQTG